MARTPQPGDDHALQRYRWWQMLLRSLFHLRRRGDGADEVWSIDVRHGGDSNGEVRAQLYRDGRNTARSKLPAKFVIPGGTIQVATSGYGMKRCHYVTDDGTARPLAPDPASAEGLRMRLARTRPGLSRAMGAGSVVVLLAGLVFGVPQIIEDITRIPPVADAVGTFVSPVHLPLGVNIALLVATLVASTERALRMRYNWILDGGAFDGDL